MSALGFVPRYFFVLITIALWVKAVIATMKFYVTELLRGMGNRRDITGIAAASKTVTH